MSNPKDSFRIDLTPEQKATIRNVTGKDAETVELSVEELEARIALLEGEIERVKAKLQNAVNFRATAESLFKK